MLEGWNNISLIMVALLMLVNFGIWIRVGKRLYRELRLYSGAPGRLTGSFAPLRLGWGHGKVLGMQRLMVPWTILLSAIVLMPRRFRA